MPSKYLIRLQGKMYVPNNNWQSTSNGTLALAQDVLNNQMGHTYDIYATNNRRH